MNRRHFRSFRSWALTGVAAAAIASPAWAQEARRFDIPQQSLVAALEAFGKQGEAEILFSRNQAEGHATAGVSGNYEPAQALAMLLDGSGLKFRQVNGNTYVVEAAAPQSGSAAGDGADGTVQALVVTAQKREENIQDVPIAMSAFTQEDLTRSQVAGGPDLMTQIPNFTFTKTNFSGYSIQIRGIGTQAISATTDPAVAVAFNNTPFIRNRFFEQEFYDLERVEVLRGPQGTLYGRNATAGVVNIISAKPNPREFAAKLSADVSNYNSTRLEGMINLPLVEDKAALRLAGEWTKRDGFVRNTLTGQQTDGRDLWSARATLGFEPTDHFSANLIYEHFEENDDRLRSGKQLCHKDSGPSEINGTPIVPTGYPLNGAGAAYFSQGCNPASLYSPDSFQTPNGYALPYYGAAGALGSPVYIALDPYLHATQSRNLREIETHIKPEYEASDDIVELQMKIDLAHDLTIASETGFDSDRVFSFEDYNRFDTTPGVFAPGGTSGRGLPDGTVGGRLDIVDQNGVFCDPQLGCTNRLAAGDLSTARSRQFSQEFRLSSDFDGPVNFNLGANFLRYDTEDKYYVFINSLTAFKASFSNPWIPGVSDNSAICFANGFSHENGQGITGYQWSNPSEVYDVQGCTYIDPNNIHNLNDEGRNYFLSKNPYHLNSYSVFGEIYYDITSSLKFTAGLRWTVDEKSAPQIPSWLLASGTYGTPTKKVINLTWREPTGRLALDWRPQLSFTDQTLVYASYVRGYKAGGANPPPPIITIYQGNITSADQQAALVTDSLAHPETFKAEFVNAFEVGTKNTSLDGKLTLNLDAFYYDYTGYQISEIVDRSAVNLNFDAKIWGAEVEADWRPWENLRLGFKGGYENTRLADGSNAIDLMDRTAGNPGWLIKRPFPTFPSNCIVPTELAFVATCEAYKLGIDPVTLLPYVPNPTTGAQYSVFSRYPDQWIGYKGFDPKSAPNNGDGFTKNLSGNELPNAPHFTATITTDYTVPLPNEWLLTLHSDLYYQSEAWTRVFNTPGYDRLKAYSNINLAAIFNNERSGLQVMAYVKNVLNRDSITGAFLNSDDTGLTTNVFLTEPRLYGLRVTKQFDGSAWWSELASHTPGAPYPLRVEFDGYYGDFSHGHQLFVPAYSSLYSPDFPFPFHPQKILPAGAGGGVKLSYTPVPDGWTLSAAIRYGRAIGGSAAHGSQAVPGGCATLYGETRICFDPTAGAATITSHYGTYVFQTDHKYNFSDTTTKNSETHTIADFMVGKDVGLGAWSKRVTRSEFSFGLDYGRFGSMSNAVMHGRPDLYFPPQNGIALESHMHRFNADLTAFRSFEGAGPALAWDGLVRLAGDPDGAGRIDVELGLGGALLFGKQKTRVEGSMNGQYREGTAFNPDRYDVTPHYDGPISVPIRNKSVTVPALNADLGLSYTIGGVNVGGGYRWERYFNVIDGGFTQRKTYDRGFDGPYFKVSVGFGG